MEDDTMDSNTWEYSPAQAGSSGQLISFQRTFIHVDIVTIQQQRLTVGVSSCGTYSAVDIQNTQK